MAYRLSEKLDDKKIITSGYSSGVFYNTSTVHYEEKLGEVSSTNIRPLQHDSIEIPLSDVFGNDLFSKIQNNTSDVQNITAFINYFKGFAMSAEYLLTLNFCYCHKFTIFNNAAWPALPPPKTVTTMSNFSAVSDLLRP